MALGASCPAIFRQHRLASSRRRTRFPRRLARFRRRPYAARCTTFPPAAGFNYDETPFLAIWEVTQSCDLACKHCRAAAQPIAHPDELTNEEGKALIDQIADMHIPIFVFTGGDPLKRPDVFELIRYAADKGVQVAVTPSATPLLTREAIFKMKEAGVVRLGISLDGSTPEIHDNFRGLAGRMGPHHPGHRVGRRGRHAHPGAHHHQPPQRRTISTTSAISSRSSTS